MAATFTTRLLVDDELDATGIVVPADVIEGLGSSRRPPVVITIDGYAYRTTVAVMGGQYLVPFSQAHRSASGVEPGRDVEVSVELDTAPRVVEVPDDLAAALGAKAGARAAFDALSYSVRKEHVRQVEEAKAAETRQRRIDRIVGSLGSD